MKKKSRKLAANDIVVATRIRFKEAFKGVIQELAWIVGASWIVSHLLEIHIAFALGLSFSTWGIWLIYRFQELKNNSLKKRISQMKLQYEKGVAELKNFATNEVRLKNEEIENLRHKVTAEQKRVTLAKNEVTQIRGQVTQLTEQVTFAEKKVIHAEVKKEEVELKVTQLIQQVASLKLEVTQATEKANRSSAQVTRKVTEQVTPFKEKIEWLKAQLQSKEKEYDTLLVNSREWELGFVSKELGRLRKGKNNEAEIARLEKRQEALQELLEKDKLKVA